jgi:UDP-N-acetylglucosamine 2-epimerase
VKVVTVLGARPQFIKAASLSKTLRESGCEELVLHTAQHYDYRMFFILFALEYASLKRTLA